MFEQSGLALDLACDAHYGQMYGDKPYTFHLRNVVDTWFSMGFGSYVGEDTLTMMVRKTKVKLSVGVTIYWRIPL